MAESIPSFYLQHSLEIVVNALAQRLAILYILKFPKRIIFTVWAYPYRS